MKTAAFVAIVLGISAFAAPVPQAALPNWLDEHFGQAVCHDRDSEIRLERGTLTISLSKVKHLFDDAEAEPVNQAPRTMRRIPHGDFSLSVTIDCADMPVPPKVFEFRSFAGVYIRDEKGHGVTILCERHTATQRGSTMQANLRMHDADGNFCSGYGWTELAGPGRYRLILHRYGDVFSASMQNLDGGNSFNWDRMNSQTERALKLQGELTIGVFASNTGPGFNAKFSEFEFGPLPPRE